MSRRLEDLFGAVGAAWNRFWFTPVETSTLALFRIAVGLVVLGWTLALAPSLYAFYSRDGILPTYPDYEGTLAWGLLEWFPGDAAVTILYFALLLASICVLVGFAARIATLIVFVCMVSFAHRNPWVLNSGDLLVQLLVFYLLLAPAGDGLSVDRWLKRDRQFWEFSRRSIWPLRLVQVQVTILYITAVWDKVRGSTWNDGTAVSYALRIGDLERFPVPGFVTDSLILANLMTFGTLAIEFALAILVWNRVLRPWVLLLGVLLHLGIDYGVRVGFFSWAVFVAYVAFIPPDSARTFILATRDRLAHLTLPAWPPLPRRSE
jgi:Vitamin K-dependent gamma-carboxylase